MAQILSLSDFDEFAYLAPDREKARRAELRERIRLVFKLFERDNSGTADVREIGTMLRALGLNPSEAQLKQMADAMELEEPLTFVKYENFEKIAMEVLLMQHFAGELLTRDSEEQLLKAFEVLDTEKRGYLDSEYIKELLTTKGEKFNNEEILELLNCAADPETGYIKYDDYATILAYD